MKRTYYIILVLLLMVALAVPAFASEYSGIELPDVYALGKDTSYYYIIGYGGKTGENRNYVLVVSTVPATRRDTTNFGDYFYDFQGEGSWWKYNMKYNGTSWGYANTNSTSDSSYFSLEEDALLWANYDIYNKSGELILDGEEYVPPMCDGSACPATDADHDNICDDCGNVLTMSLRSELYEYAIGYTDRYTENNPQYGHRIITKDSDSRYSVFISTSPGTYDSETNTLSFTDGKQTFVTEKADGSFVGDGWAILTSIPNALTFRDTIYYSNYTIEGFFPPPLWETMGQVTQGEMGALTTETLGTMKVLVACGVGLIALLAVLNLFGRRSLISRG